jgi:hypothetical protein
VRFVTVEDRTRPGGCSRRQHHPAEVSVASDKIF